MAASPTRKIRLYALGIILLCLLYLTWIFFLNRGQLEITGPAPFMVDVPGGGGERTCTTSPCSVSLHPREYTVTLKKENYYPVSYRAPIKLWKTVYIEAGFRLVPQLKLVTIAESPRTEKPPFDSNFENIPVSAPAIHEGLLNRLKRSVDPIQKIIFSPSGEKFLSLTEKRVELYQTTNPDSRQRLDLSPELDFTWDNQSENLLYLEPIQAKEKQALLRFSLTDLAAEAIAYFTQPIKNSLIFPSADDRYLAVADVPTVSPEPAPASLYWLDLENSTREFLFETETIYAAEISPDNQHLVYWGKHAYPFLSWELAFHRFVFYYDLERPTVPVKRAASSDDTPDSDSANPESSSVIPDPDRESNPEPSIPEIHRTLHIITKPELSFWTPERTFLFVTYQTYQTAGDAKNPGPTKIKPNREFTFNQFRIMAYDPVSDTYTLLLEPEIEYQPVKFTWDNEKNTAYLLAGEQVYELVME